MTYVVRLEGFTPGERGDGTPWTLADLEESTTATGPGTLLETFALSPLDTDPTNPVPRSFTTTLATLAAGWYRVVFRDAAGHSQATGWVFNGAEFMPSVADVGALLRDRTVAAGSRGEELGTFTVGTRPTRDEVENLIARAANVTLAAFPGVIAPQVFPGLRELIALRAAIKIEESYFSEQVDADSRRVDGFRLDATALQGLLVPTAEENIPGVVTARGYGSVPIETVMTVPVTDPAGLLP